jgi:hypothetical protein
MMKLTITDTSTPAGFDKLPPETVNSPEELAAFIGKVVKEAFEHGQGGMHSAPHWTVAVVEGV